MPRGRKKKVVEKKILEGGVDGVEETVDEQDVQESVEVKEDLLVDAAGNKIEPLSPGQKYFETPDGRILIGEESHSHIWDRVTQAWVNPKR